METADAHVIDEKKREQMQWSLVKISSKKKLQHCYLEAQIPQQHQHHAYFFVCLFIAIHVTMTIVTNIITCHILN